MQEPDAATDTVAVERFNRVLAGDVTMQDVPEGECIRGWGAESVLAGDAMMQDVSEGECVRV